MRAAPSAEALLRLVWGAPFAAWAQGPDHLLLDVNDAFVSLMGFGRNQLLGRDPIELEPAEDRDGSRVARHEMMAAAALGQPPPALRRRLRDAAGREHWFSIATQNVAAGDQPAHWLSLLQDVTPEVAAREQTQRAQTELASWFELSHTGMLVYDHTGLLVRSNAAFEALVDRVPEVLDDASPELQALLAWQPAGQGAQGTIHPGLAVGAAPVERRAAVPAGDGRRRQLQARLLAFAADGGQPRVMAVVEDRSAEEERDLARLEMGMLMDTASIGVATYDPARGWLAPTPRAPAAAAAAPSPPAGPTGAPRSQGALLGIGRELVEPESLPEYERLQRALRNGERTEVRYAVRHPELGARWLLTRVEPGALAGGRRTTSVVTLDITEQERAQQRNNQLLRELTTILDGSTAGIAYLRGPLLARCNRRFERMLGFAPGAAAGATLAEIFGHGSALPDAVQQASVALALGRPFEAELPVDLGEGAGGSRGIVWYSLSVRRAEGAGDGDEAEAVAVLTDISRLKSQQAELEQLLRDRELMFSLSEVGIVYLRGARIERANLAMATLTGSAAPELTLLDAAELYENARECVAFEAQVAQALRERGRFRGERLLRRRDSSLHWVQVAVRPVDAEDLEAGLICSFVDIDERRRARETLAVQAERTRAILNSVLVGIVTVSDKGIEWMNRSARRMFAGELADFVGEPISTVATPEPEHPLRQGNHLLRLQEGRAETFECRLRGRDGREFWVVGNAVLTAGSEDGGRQVTFALLDIERRRQAEISIAQAQASLQRVIETAPLAIALFDARSQRVLQVNQTAASFFGCGLDAVLAQGLGACPQAAKAQALRDWLQDAAGQGERTQHEWRDEAETGEPDDSGGALRVWDVRVAPLAAAGGVAAQLLLVASDVTEQRMAEQARLRAAIDQRELLVREVHHRIKNNLQGVAGLLQQNAARHPEVAVVLSEAVGQVRAIAQVYGLQVGMTGPLGLAGLLRAIAQSVQLTFGQTISVAQPLVEIPHLLPEPEAIPVALVLNELLTNAIKHGLGGGVRCALQAQGTDVLVQISGRGQLPEGFSLAAVRGGVSGLGLVRALLPRRSAELLIEQRGDEVMAEVRLRPPSVRLPLPLPDLALSAAAAPPSSPPHPPQPVTA
jgi:PAS domain S-box-containing protein